MTSASIAEQADCLRSLGQLVAAAKKYQHSIELDKKRSDYRSAAWGQFQLGLVRMLQRHYDEALQIYIGVLGQFETLDDFSTMATVWHRIGIVHRLREDYDKARDAYLQGLTLMTEHNLQGSNMAASLGELGNLYDSMGQLEEAVIYHRKATDIYVILPNRHYEGIVRNNTANALFKLGRYSEAREEVSQAIECMQIFSHEIEPWKIWSTLHKIEKIEGNSAAAQEAWQEARTCYLAYRRDGGDAQGMDGKLCEDILPALQAGEMAAVGEFLAEQLANDVPEWGRMLIGKLQAIVAGSRAVGLADDFALDFGSAAEILLLLERLGAVGD